MEETINQVLFLLKGVWKYRWHAVIVAWVIALAGWIRVYTLDDNYQASARVFVDTQSILKPLMSGMTTLPNVEQQVSIMSRTLLSRPNVEKVMRMVDLDIKAKTPKENEELINDLMKEIRISSTGRDDIYTISYNNPNPRIAKDVVQSLLTIFVEGSFGDKKNDSDKAVQFLDEQIKNYEAKLVAAENALKDFKIKHSGSLPQGGDYGTQVQAASDQLNQARLDLREAEQARNAIQVQIMGNGTGATTAGALVNPELDGRILALQKNLDTMRMQYTEQHPDIISAKRLIKQLEAQKVEEAKNFKAGGDRGANYSPMLQQLNVALSAAEARVASMRARVDEFTVRFERLRAQSINGPELETQMAQLNRDYQVNKENYQQMVSRREAARLSGDLTNTTDMVKFRVVDPPTVPLRPAGPDRLRLASLVFLGALIAGIAFAMLLSQLRPTYLSQHGLRESTGLPILGSVSMNWTDHERAKRKRSFYAFGASLAILVTLYAGVMARMLLTA
ncbi:XrtA system polysaccharide chain length determinant [Noviherbaspirillum suwonense]|uniref:Polysaccharide chain length determinant protein, PEP-CTERM locus subfamily n=1 Tax=Noviherbaspirillum suwonense TaxID=1224511 RepID=A0ABY1QF44_9BURK|nr:XrtA system polysaccharide chain length determinant [Noviherbaspirillum suwonense]SMP69523.1 polysaccharide chain length determinant protein, PEP-CTERM locus subfamily [Noviherbaspirillum suwonense]